MFHTRRPIRRVQRRFGGVGHDASDSTEQGSPRGTLLASAIDYNTDWRCRRVWCMARGRRYQITRNNSWHQGTIGRRRRRVRMQRGDVWCSNCRHVVRIVPFRGHSRCWRLVLALHWRQATRRCDKKCVVVHEGQCREARWSLLLMFPGYLGATLPIMLVD
jgi:hypothetical protein